MSKKRKGQESKERYIIIDSEEAVDEVVDDLMEMFTGSTMSYTTWHQNRDNEAKEVRNNSTHKK